MSKKPVQGFERDLRAAVLDYHNYHGDKNIELKQFVCDPCGGSAILTRVKDAQGKEKSWLLLLFGVDYESEFGWQIRETRGCNRKDEFLMLQDFRGSPEEV